MVENFDKIVNFFTKLNDYYVISDEKPQFPQFVVGTKIDIKEHKPYVQMFNHLDYTPREFHIFFLVTATSKSTELDKFFEKNGLKVLKLKKSDTKSLNVFRETLDKFVIEKFCDHVTNKF